MLQPIILGHLIKAYMETKMTFGEKSDWVEIGKIETTGCLSLSDTSYFYDQPVIVDIDPGIYSVAVSFVKIDGHLHIARAKVATSAVDSKLGREIGAIGVDFGQIGVCDRSFVEAAFDALGDDGMPEYFDQLGITELNGVVSLKNVRAMFIFKPGFGDGSYPVYELIGPNGVRRGVEVDCMHGVS